MLQSWRGKAAIGKALCLSRYLSPSLAEGVQYSILFEQLSLTLFILFGSGLSGLGDPTANCPSSTGKYVVGFVVTEASGGIQNIEDILEITIIVPREAATESVILRQRRDPAGASGWSSIALRTASVTIYPAANTVFAGSPAQCGSSIPCYPIAQRAIDYVATGGIVNIMGSFTENVVIGRSMTLQRGNTSASLTSAGNNTISIDDGTVVIKDFAVIAGGTTAAINVNGGIVTVKGNAIDANSSVAFNCLGGSLNAYANNLSNLGTAKNGSACTANLAHNWWGTYDGSGPIGLGSDWDARLGNLVESYSDGYLSVPGGNVTLGGASMGGGTGTAIIVSHGKDYPPFGNGIAKYINSMCGIYFDFFVRGGSGNWNVVMPVDNNPECTANVLNQHAVFKITNIADCAMLGDPACWDPVTVGVSIIGQTLQVSGIPAFELSGTQYVVGSTDGSDPTAIRLRSLTASSARNTGLPITLLLIALLLGSGGLLLAYKRR